MKKMIQAAALTLGLLLALTLGSHINPDFLSKNGEGGQLIACENVLSKTTTSTKPGAIKSLLWISSTSSSVKLTWLKSSGASGYYVYRSTDNKKFSKIAKTSSITYVATGLSACTVYYFKVVPYKTGKKTVCGPASSVVRTQTSIGRVSLTGLERNLASDGKRIKNSISLSWKKVSAASGYAVYRSTSGQSFVRIAVVSADGKLTYGKKNEVSIGKDSDSSTIVLKNNWLSAGASYNYKVIPYRTRSDLRCIVEPTVSGAVCLDRIFVAPATTSGSAGNATAWGTRSKPYTSIQQALDLAQAGTTVCLMPGTYKVSATNEFVSSGKKDAYIRVTAMAPDQTVITKSAKSDDDEAFAAFALEGNDYIKIDHLNIKNLKGKTVYGILLTGGENHVEIRDCEISGIETTYPDGEGEANGILLFGEGATTAETIKDVVIDGNYVHDNVNGWSENISVSSNCENITISNNRVENCTNIGIDFYGNAEYCSDPTLDQPRNCTATGNTVINCRSLYAENAGIYVDGAHDIILSGNTTSGNYYGIEVGSEEWRDYYTDANLVKNITVSGNTISGNTDGGIRIGGYTRSDGSQQESDEIKLTGVVASCTITGNTFRNNGSGEGEWNGEVFFAKCGEITLSNNNFYRNVAKETGDYLIFNFDEFIYSDRDDNDLVYGTTNCDLKLICSGNQYLTPDEDATFFLLPGYTGEMDLDGDGEADALYGVDALNDLTGGDDSWAKYTK